MRRSRLFRRTIWIMIGLFGVISVCTSLLSGWVLYDHLYDEYTSKGIAITQSIAESNVETIMSRDASTVQTMLDNYLDIAGLGYVYVVDSEGDMVAHTFVPAFPEILRDQPDPEATRVAPIEIPGVGVFIDIGAPILAGVGGYVHVGMDRDLIIEYIVAAMVKLQGLLVGILLFAVAVMYVLVRRIARPLSDLTEYAQRLAAHDFTATVHITSRDEVGILANTMRSMAEEISSLVSGLERAVLNATEELQQNLAHSRAIINNMADGLLVTDPTGRISFLNPAFTRMYGKEAGELAGRMAADVLPVDLTALTARASQTPSAIHTGEVSLRGSNVGKAVATAIYDAPHEGVQGHDDPDTKHLGSVVLVRDITVEKEVDRMKTDFISTVSHELRTPLTSVLGFAKIIKKRFESVILPALAKDQTHSCGPVGKAAQQVQQNVEIIVTEGRRLTELINDVLDISKMESGEVEWRTREIDMRRLVEQSAAATTSLFTEKRLPLRLEIPEFLPPVLCDPDRIIQVMVNLLSNAVKFTDKGEVVIALKADHECITVSVTDTGSGMESRDMDRIFDRFKQAGDTLTQKPKGTGLGLAICRHIVESHGGSIWAESMPGQGSVFHFQLLYRPPEDVPTRAAAVGAAPLPRNQEHETLPEPSDRPQSIPLIMVVDDDPPMRSYLSQVFEEEGFHVITAEDGFKALEILERARPDLITMDLMMPGMDGRTVIGRLRQNPGTMHIPILVISALNLMETPGADAALVKPVDEDKLVAAVHGLLHGEMIGTGACMVLTANGLAQNNDLLLACPGNVTYCRPGDVWRELEKGFSGIVFVPSPLSRTMNLDRLCGAPSVQVVILPEWDGLDAGDDEGEAFCLPDPDDTDPAAQ